MDSTDSPQGTFSIEAGYIILHDQQVLQSGVQNLQMQDRLAHCTGRAVFKIMHYLGFAA